jgi:hypothetical protein
MGRKSFKQEADAFIDKVVNGTGGESYFGTPTSSDEKSIQIIGAALKDDFCNYDYELLTGPTAGDTLNRSGNHIVHNDLKNAFKKLIPHLAVVCEQVSKEEITDIEAIADFDDKVHQEGSLEHKISHYFITSFTSVSSGENESVVLKGSRRLSDGDFIDLKTPKIRLHGEYQFVNELIVAIDDIKHEVELYMTGKSAPKFVQQGIEFPEEQFAETER